MNLLSHNFYRSYRVANSIEDDYADCDIGENCLHPSHSRSMIDFESSDKVRVIFWGLKSEKTSHIFESFATKLNINKVFCLPILFEEEISLFDLEGLKRFEEFINYYSTDRVVNQIHIILPEDINFKDRHETSKVRLSALFRICELSVKSNINFIFCDLPVLSVKNILHRFFYINFNEEFRMIIESNSDCNVNIFNSQVFYGPGKKYIKKDWNLNEMGLHFYALDLRTFVYKHILDMTCNRLLARDGEVHKLSKSYPCLGPELFRISRDDLQLKIRFILKWRSRRTGFVTSEGLKMIQSLINNPDVLSLMATN